LAKTDTSHKIEEFAEDLGKLLGTARAKAEGWLGQRASIVKQLTQLRDEANTLLRDLGHEAEGVFAVDGGGIEGTWSRQRGRSAPTAEDVGGGSGGDFSGTEKRWAKQKAGEKK